MSELDGVKVGDKLILECDFSANSVVEVERTTDKQIIASGTRFWKKDGSIVGNYFHARLCIPSEGEIEEIEERKLAAKYRTNIERELQHLHLDELKRIWEIIKGEKL